MPCIKLFLSVLVIGSAVPAKLPMDAPRALRFAQSDCKNRLPNQDNKDVQSTGDCPIDTSPGSTGGAKPDETHMLETTPVSKGANAEATDPTPSDEPVPENK